MTHGGRVIRGRATESMTVQRLAARPSSFFIEDVRVIPGAAKRNEESSPCHSKNYRRPCSNSLLTHAPISSAPGRRASLPAARGAAATKHRFMGGADVTVSAGLALNAGPPALQSEPLQFAGAKSIKTPAPQTVSGLHRCPERRETQDGRLRNGYPRTGRWR